MFYAYMFHSWSLFQLSKIITDSGIQDNEMQKPRTNKTLFEVNWHWGSGTLTIAVALVTNALFMSVMFT